MEFLNVGKVQAFVLDVLGKDAVENLDDVGEDRDGLFELAKFLLMVVLRFLG